MADIKIAVTAVNAPTATGNFDITDSRLGGITPKAVMLFATNHVAANDASATLTAIHGIGVLDGTRERSISFRGQNGIANSLTSRREARNNSATFLQDPSNSTTFLHVATFVAFITNGVRLNFTDIDATGRRIVAVFFGGADLQAYAGTVALGTGTSAIDVTDPGFPVELLIGFGSHDDIAAGNGLFYGATFGMALANGTQKGQSLSAPSAEAENMAQIIWSDKIGGQKATGGTGVDYTLLASDFDATGFSITPSASAGSDDWLYLALNLGGNSVSLFDFETPDAIGVVSYETPGFEPAFGLTVTTFLPARDAGTFDNDVGTLSIGVFDQGLVEWAPTTWSAWFSSAVHTSQARSQTRIFSVAAFDPVVAGSTTGARANLDSFDALGFNLNYDTVDATPRMGFALAVAGNALVEPDVTVTELRLETLFKPDGPDARVREVRFEALYVPINPPARVREVRLEVLRSAAKAQVASANTGARGMDIGRSLCGGCRRVGRGCGGRRHTIA